MSAINWPDPNSIPWEQPYRRENRRMVRVVVRPLTKVVASTLCHRGENFVLMYEKDIPRYAARVMNAEASERLKAAESANAIKFAEWRKSHKTDEDARATFGGSVEAEYHAMWNADVPPYDALDVHPDVIGPPDSAETRVEQSRETIERAISSLAEGQKMIAESLAAKRPQEAQHRR